MPARHQRLYINIDHVATLRQARGGIEPSPVEAAAICERAGADGITAHLREDRRHVQDADVETLATSVTTYFNLEAACVDEMLRIAQRLRPPQVTLVPERREEVTTEGGLDIEAERHRVERAVRLLRDAGIRVSLFINPTVRAVQLSRELGAQAVELHTGEYSHRPHDPSALESLIEAATTGSSIGIAVHAGHGLTVRNVARVAAIEPVEELNIGHSIVSRALFVGLEAAVKEIRREMDVARTAIEI